MPRLHQFIGTVCIATLFLISATASAEEPAARPLILAVHPYLPYDEIHTRYRPLADYLQAQLNKTVVVRVGRNYDEHIKFIGKDEVDIAYMGPAAYLEMVRTYGHNNRTGSWPTPSATWSRPPIVGSTRPPNCAANVSRSVTPSPP